MLRVLVGLPHIITLPASSQAEKQDNYWDINQAIYISNSGLSIIIPLLIGIIVNKVLYFKVPLLLLCLLLALGEAQNNRRPNRNRQSRRPVRQNRQGQFLRNGVTRNGSRDRKGTEVYPGCKGKVCLPDAQLCAERQKKVGRGEGGEGGIGGEGGDGY